MYPFVLDFAGIRVTSYGLMLVLALLAGAAAFALQLRRRGLSPAFAREVIPWVAVGGVAGAKLYYILLHWQEFAAAPVAVLTGRGGLVWYGAMLGGIAGFYLLARLRKLPALTLFDAAAPALVLGYAIGRVGCFLVGDDYGLPTASWVGIAFPEGSPPSTAGYLRSVGAEVPAGIPDWQVLAVHPTQLYEVGLALLIFLVLWRLSSRWLQPGQLFGLCLALYGTQRFLIEFIRAKSDRFVLGLTTSQVVSLLLLCAAAYLWQRGASARRASPAAGLPVESRIRAAALEGRE